MAYSTGCFLKENQERQPLRGSLHFFALILILAGNSCANFSDTNNRRLQGADLSLHASLSSLHTNVRAYTATEPFKLYRLIPSNESNPKEHGIVRLPQNGPNLVVESHPVAIGRYEKGMVSFRLPDNFEPSTHCFIVVSHGSWGIPTSSFGELSKRLFIGLKPFSKKYRSLTALTVEDIQARATKIYTDQELQCEGTIEDFVNTNPNIRFVKGQAKIPITLSAT